ncbi:MAG: hypothetical protein L3K07_02985 [Thermoplasmata archaeon]|nr:hypothetical protein [Thermoplasmata archaeon]
MEAGTTAFELGGVEPRLDDRILAFLSGEPGEITFNGMRRALAAHPESLTRALRRLSRDGRVLRETRGYRLGMPPALAPTGKATVPGYAEPRRALVAEVRLPPAEPVPELLGRLAGRWFGQLRWVGTYDRPKEPLLVWSRADGRGQLLLGLRRGHLRVYAEPPPSALAPSEGRALEEAARELLWHALGFLASSPNGWSHDTTAAPGTKSRENLSN